MESSATEETVINQNADGSKVINYSQQIIDPAMVTIFLLPSLFFTSCSGIFAVDNTFGIPGSVEMSIVLIFVIFIAAWFVVKHFNNKAASITIVPDQGVVFGDMKLSFAAIKKIGMEAASIGKNCFRVYAMSGDDKIFITEYVSASSAKAIMSGIQEQLGKF